MQYKIFISILIIIACQSCEVVPKTVKWTDDYYKGLELAKNEDAKILLVFDSWSNPTSSTLKIFESSKVISVLDDYVVILLFVEGKNVKDKSVIKLQREKFNTNFQPVYYVIGSDEKILKGPQGYCKEKEFLDFITN